MRVALLTYSTKPRGGVVHTLALAEALARAGADVDVWTLARGGDRTFFRAVDPAVGLRPVPFPDVPGEAVGARILRSIRTLRDALRGADYDVVHAQDCISANAALAAGLRCLRTIHHLDTFTTPELVACHDRAVLEPAGHVCVSEAVAREHRQREQPPEGGVAEAFGIAAIAKAERGEDREGQSGEDIDETERDHAPAPCPAARSIRLSSSRRRKPWIRKAAIAVGIAQTEKCSGSMT